MEELSWITRPRLRDPIALFAFTGWNDAAEAASGALWHLLATNDTLDVAVIDHDTFNDHQVSRPIVSYEGGDRVLTWPETRVYSIETDQDRDLLVILGEEPRLRWKAFTRIIEHVLSELGSTEALALGAFVGEVAHTVPVPVFGVADSPERREALGLLPPTYEGPSGMTGVLTQVLGDAHLDVTSLWAATPHYLSGSANPKASRALLEKAEAVLRLDLGSELLGREVTDWEHRIAAAVADSEELTEYLAELEDSTESYSQPSDTAGQLVEEIEKFLQDPNQ